MTIPKTMKAAVVEKFGEPLMVREVPVSAPGPGKPWWKSWPAECVTPTCTPPTVIGRSNRLFLLFRGMKAPGLSLRSDPEYPI